MGELEVRVHDTLGWVVRAPGGEWWLILRSTGRPQERAVTDAFVRGTGWRALTPMEDVVDPPLVKRGFGIEAIPYSTPRIDLGHLDPVVPSGPPVELGRGYIVFTELGGVELWREHVEPGSTYTYTSGSDRIVDCQFIQGGRELSLGRHEMRAGQEMVIQT